MEGLPRQVLSLVAGGPLRPEDMHCSDHILPADGAFVHTFPTLGAGDHVATFQEDTVDGRVHTDFAEVLLRARK